MPIQINLLNDALAEQELRRRDPVKRALFAGSFLVALMLVWFSSISLEHMVANSNLARVQSEIQAHTNDYNVVVANLKSYHDAQNRLDALNKLSSARFLQGNLMNALQELYVSNVSLTRFEVAQGYTRSGGQENPPTTPVTILEHTVLTIDAKDSSPSPGDQVNHSKDAIGKLDFFKTHLDPTDGVKLSNLSPPSTALGSKPFVLFTITCRFPDQTR